MGTETLLPASKARVLKATLEQGKLSVMMLHTGSSNSSGASRSFSGSSGNNNNNDNNNNNNN